MLKTLHKSILITWLLMLSCSQIVHAETKLYRYDGKLPFVKMMLNMMSAMGMIDKLPANGAYGRHGFSNSPFSRSPWLQTPWSSSTLNNSNLNSASPVWGSPSWGVLPSNSYASNNYSMYDPYGTSSTWSTYDLDGWVNETWETSQWNPKAEAPVQAKQPQLVQPSAPLVQNFNYNVPDKAERKVQKRTRQQAGKQSPLSRLAQTNRPMGQPAQQSNRAPAGQQKKQSPLHKKTRPAIRQKPCITDSCGLQKPNLNGLWVAQNGEMFGVKNKRYLWSDDNSRYLTGQLLIQNEYLIASVDGYEKVMRYKYKLAGNRLLTLKPDGTIREFVRMQGNPYYGQQYY